MPTHVKYKRTEISRDLHTHPNVFIEFGHCEKVRYCKNKEVNTCTKRVSQWVCLL